MTPTKTAKKTSTTRTRAPEEEKIWLEAAERVLNRHLVAEARATGQLGHRGLDAHLKAFPEEKAADAESFRKYVRQLMGPAPPGWPIWGDVYDPTNPAQVKYQRAYFLVMIPAVLEGDNGTPGTESKVDALVGAMEF
ncbi:hypothetical protein Q8F55_002468 [Vanrija albida]|uniref:Uncharacterized protein n=1 Tax=Vanrija albida TaxID=181172 RepID=A0ABR3QA17_9TREE